MTTSLSAILKRKTAHTHIFNTAIQQKIIDLLQANFKKLAIPALSLKLFAKYHIKPKFLRSNLLVCLAPELGYTDDPINDERLMLYCVIIELLHIANKIHDSINNIAANNQYNLSLPQAILLGDLIFTIAFEQITSIGHQEILEQFSQSTKNIALCEAKLSECETLDLNTIILLIEQKQWPLFNNIIFFLEQYSKADPIIISVIKNINSINVRSKLLQTNITLPPILHDFLYLNKKNTQIINTDMQSVIADTKVNIQQYWNSRSNTSNHKIIDELNNLLTIASN